MLRTSIVHQPSYLCRTPGGAVTGKSATGWRRFVLVGYVLLFACVLPCLCWGAVGTPGHPHAAPHFVFTEPPHSDDTATSTATSISVPAPHQHASHISTCHPHTDGSGGVDGASDAAGRSVPDTATVVSLIMLTLLVGWSFFVPRLYQVTRRLATLFAESADLPVPTPPPRIPAFASFALAV